VDVGRLGREVRALRQRRRWRQSDLAAVAHLSQSEVSRVELGQSRGVTLATLEHLAAALGARVSVRLHWQGEALDRLLDAAHARLVELVVRILKRYGWEVATEVTFSIFGERGSVDVMGRHVGRRLLVIVEVKASIGDVQATQASFDRKVRHAHAIARQLGWAPWPVARLLVVSEGTVSRRRIAEHAATFALRWPERSRAVRRWLAGTSSDPIAGLWFLSPTRRVGGTRRVRVGGRRPDSGHPTGG
jgi:transcriptional regulator with XRE-family HTH domain